MRVFPSAFVMVLMLSGCGPHEKLQEGAAIGAATGAGIGAGIGALAGNPRLGALLGGLIGAGVGAIEGAKLDAESEARRQEALNRLARAPDPQPAIPLNPVAPSTMPYTRQPSASPHRPLLASRSVPTPTVAWTNPSSETSGTIEKKTPVQLVNGKECMMVNETVTIKGKPEQVEDMRCRAPDGHWT